MSNFTTLLMGEFQRMKKYNITTASLMVAVIWIGLMQFIEIRDVTTLFPLLIFLDATSMSILLIGVTMFFEKQEGVIKTLLVSPISKAEYILAKSIANIFSNLLTLGILYVYAYVFKEINLNVLLLFIYVTLIGFFHSMIGFIITYYSKDFTNLLMAMLKYSFVLVIPVMLYELGILSGSIIKSLLYLVPTQAAMTLLNSTASTIDFTSFVISLLYLFIGSIILYYIVNKKFDEFSIRESGV